MARSDSRIARAQSIARPGPSNTAKNAVAGRVEPLAAKAHQLATHDRVVAREELPPGGVPDLGGARSRADDVGEEHSRQYAIRLARRREVLEELMRFAQEDGVPLGIGPAEVVAEAFHLDPPRSVNPLCCDVGGLIARL